jgi:hypothetical protein
MKFIYIIFKNSVPASQKTLFLHSCCSWKKTIFILRILQTYKHTQWAKMQSFCDVKPGGRGRCFILGYWQYFAVIDTKVKNIMYSKTFVSWSVCQCFCFIWKNLLFEAYWMEHFDYLKYFSRLKMFVTQGSGSILWSVRFRCNLLFMLFHVI